MKGNYLKLLLSLTISFFIMYSVMFLNVAEAGHIFINTNRAYMAILMVAPMAVVMIGVMWKMFENVKLNIGIIATSILVFIIALVFLRNQVFINDEQYMNAMIPHHSSAILTSEQADIQDPEVRKLADEIIKTQKEEIALMKQLLQKVD